MMRFSLWIFFEMSDRLDSIQWIYSIDRGTLTLIKCHLMKENIGY